MSFEHDSGQDRGVLLLYNYNQQNKLYIQYLFIMGLNYLIKIKHFLQTWSLIPVWLVMGK